MWKAPFITIFAPTTYIIKFGKKPTSFQQRARKQMAIPNPSVHEDDSTVASDTTPIVQSLVEAARYGDIDDVREILPGHVLADCQDSQGRAALHMAAANGHLNVVQYLLDCGANVNVQNAEGNTPLHWAALNGQRQVIQELIARGANASALNRYERTPLDEAVSRGNHDVIDAIVTATAASSIAVADLNE